MKLKYIFASIVATLALAVGCQKEADHYLKEVKVSSSYLTFPTEGGSVNVTVTATQDWSINTIPEWITATPANGSAGETKVTFTAIATTQTRENDFTITSGTVGQTIKARQVAEVVEPETVNVAAALALIKAVDKGDGGSYNVSGTYRVKGIVCKISEISTSYGNATYYLSDDGKFDSEKALQVYRGLWLEGGPFTKGNEFAVGDELTIEGQLMSYKGTPETAEKTAYVVSIKKSLIGVEGTELMNVEEGVGVTEYPVEGGSIKVYIMTKGNGFHVNIPAEAKSWLHIEDFGTDYVTLSADANEGGDRDVTVGFTTTSGNETYACEQTLSQKGAIVDATVAEFLAAEVGNTQYRLTGVISKGYVESQGQSFYIKDYTGEVLVYRTDNFKESALEIGDVCSVVGKRGAYNNNPQMVNGHVEAVVEIVEEADIPIVLAATDGDWFRVTGTIKEIANPTYGNMTITDGTNDLFIYGVYPGYGATGDARKNLVEKLGLKAGDEITVFGPKGTKNSEPQISNGIYWSHKSAGEGGGDEIIVASPYVLSVTAGENSSYAGNCDITIGNLVWNLTGNSTMDPWRIGGKSITDTERPLYNKTPISFDVAKIEVEHGTVDDITVNSFTLIVSTNADFSSPVSTLTGTVTANETTTFNRPEGVKWEKCYFKFVYNVTVSASSNKYVQFKKATFTE